MQINLIGPINQLGYGIATLNIIKWLLLNQHEVALYPIGPGHVPYSDIHLIEQAQTNAKRYNMYAPSVRIWHAHDLAMHVGRGVKFGFPIFEVNKFNEEELHQLRRVSKLLVASHWAKQVIIDNNIEVDTYVVPLGVDGAIFNENIPAKKTTTTVFFNCGKWEIRKGHEILIRAFNKAFEPDDDVKLMMHCQNPFLTNDSHWHILCAKSKLGKENKISVSKTRFDTQIELARYMMQADCGVFPTSAEGWNLELLEMMSMGKLVIATDYSGHTEYVNRNNCMLLPIQKMVTAVDKIWFNGNAEWASIDEDLLIHYMRDVHKTKQEERDILNTAGIATAKQFTWQNTVDKLIEALTS